MHDAGLQRILSLRMPVAIALVMVLAGCSSISPFALSRHQRPPDDGYYRATKGKVSDAAGQPVKLVGVSWFGFETVTCAPHGLNYRNWMDMIVQIKGLGFNVLRLPFSNQLLDDPKCLPMGIDYRKNPDLKGLAGLSLLDRIIQGAGSKGLKVILDRHSPTAGVRGELWYTEDVPESRWISDWVMLARHYRGDRTVIAADLENEPHGAATWGDGNPKTDWRLAAERAGNAILKVNPDWLIMVQGIQYYHNDQYWWGGQLEGAAKYPVRLSHPNKLVYTPHDYGPDVSPQGWFNSPDYPRNLPKVWLDHWAALPQGGTPILIGEFGGHSVGGDVGGQWQRLLISYLNQHSMGYVYWSWNPDSSDTSGLLQRDWKTVNKPELAVLQGRLAPPPDKPPKGSPKPVRK
jgi:endoglucanase